MSRDCLLLMCFHPTIALTTTEPWTNFAPHQVPGQSRNVYVFFPDNWEQRIHSGTPKPLRVFLTLWARSVLGYFHLACCVPRIFSTLFLQYFVIFAKVIFGTPILIGFWGIFGDFGDFWWFWCFWWFSIISVILVIFLPSKREGGKKGEK